MKNSEEIPGERLPDPSLRQAAVVSAGLAAVDLPLQGHIDARPVVTRFDPELPAGIHRVEKDIARQVEMIHESILPVGPEKHPLLGRRVLEVRDEASILAVSRQRSAP